MVNVMAEVIHLRAVQSFREERGSSVVQQTLNDSFSLIGSEDFRDVWTVMIGVLKISSIEKIQMNAGYGEMPKVQTRQLQRCSDQKEG